MKVKNRKKIRIAAIMAAIAVCCISLCACDPDPPPEPMKTEYTLTYTVESGGKIFGASVQTIEEGGDGTIVTASAENGYRFVKWSDGLEANSRTDTNITESKTYTAIFEKRILNLSYSAANGGHIEGDTEQSVEYGANGITVRAIAEEGYEFKNWSDGEPYAERTDKSVKTNKTVTAYFEEYTRTFELDYKFGEMSEGDDKPETVTLTYANLKEYKFPVPTREHFTFGGWYIGETCLTDASGKATASEDIIRSKEQQIHAKWTANETFTYKILLVYVTRIDAVLPTRDRDDTIHVDYTMSDKEREFCALTTVRLKQHMDEMCDGLVDFQIDEYYTAETSVTEHFTQSIMSGKISNSLSPRKMPEVKELAATYDSAMSVIALNDYDCLLYNEAGNAGAKYGCVYFDPFYQILSRLKYNLDDVIQLLKDDRDYRLPGQKCDLLEAYWFGTFIHELAHTIEMRVNLSDYHHAVVYELHYIQHKQDYEANKYYYLCEAMIDGEKVGVPYSFWKGDIATVVLRTSSQGMGSVGMRSGHLSYTFNPNDGSMSCEFLFGSETTLIALPMRANPDKEFRFVRWSDGVTTPERTELITGDLDLTAIFEEVTE